MNAAELARRYERYIDCLNRRDWSVLGDFVHDSVIHNGRRLGVAGYRGMLEQDHADIPDLRFDVELLVAEPPHVASRLRFRCTPTGTFLGLRVDGRTVTFAEHVFYEFRDGKIFDVRSILDKPALEAQLLQLPDRPAATD